MRNIGTIIGALFQVRHYRAFWNMLLYSDDFGSIIKRYLFNKGEYPFKAVIKTDVSKIAITLYNHHDVLTLNEIFFRKDYSVSEDMKKSTCIIDIGANIGVSALYFISQSPGAKVYLYEPDERNFKKLKINLEPYKDHIVFESKAVSTYSGETEFSIEEFGRYGGIGRNFVNKIKVECVDINDVFRSVLSINNQIDILKIDTEGLEFALLNSINEKLLDKIKVIFFEHDGETKNQTLSSLYTSKFLEIKSGTVRTLHNKNYLK